ncbi:MAG: 16S rRNA (cytosine(1402)-N(4))-methyltransferase [Rhodospirillaceae bacterium]|nr:16S rRNA (cytosine(1402)-N(4))-methyltransferase [Rhodospirillaceae bacterium]|tara:strand:- start:7659 stop:8609 length:951 start_codon:yes stop_codon:yes gene_type:complete
MNESNHTPVMIEEVIKFLNPVDEGLYVDGTFGGGGYTKHLLNKTGCKVIAIDRDQTAIEGGFELRKQYSNRLKLVNDCFGNLEGILKKNNILKVNGIAIDLGVSSLQIDNADRGFSFMRNGPLDMRMSSSGMSASEIVNNLDQKSLYKLIKNFGEEKYANKISRAIIFYRNKKPIITTEELSLIISKVVRRGKSKIHPATRTFQALRIAVNEELKELKKILLAAEKSLLPGGVIVVVSFHSLEDRIVKKFFLERSGRISNNRHLPQLEKYLPTFSTVTKMLRPSEKEILINPRSSSAKLRAAMRTDAETLFKDDFV